MPLIRSWVDSANRAACPFPLNNLPYGVFSVAGDAPRCGTAIGDRIVDLAAAEARGLLDAGGTFAQGQLNGFMALGRTRWDAVRARLIELLAEDGERTHINARTILASTALVALTVIPALSETPIRCSHQLPPQHEVAQVIEGWAAEVETLSNGELDIQLFGANALAKPEENIPSVAKGSFKCAFSVNFQWGKTLPAMNVTLRPYAFSQPESWRKWPASEPAAYLEGLMEEKRLKNIAWLFQTRMSVFTSNGRPLAAPADFQGIKIRGLNPAFDTGLTAMGAATMPGSEVNQALSTAS